MWNIVFHRRIEHYAKELEDTAALAKLKEGDMVAIEAKYHIKCLVGFYNKHRALSNVSSPAFHCEDNITEGNLSRINS